MQCTRNDLMCCRWFLKLSKLTNYSIKSVYWLTVWIASSNQNNNTTVLLWLGFCLQHQPTSRINMHNSLRLQKTKVLYFCRVELSYCWALKLLNLSKKCNKRKDSACTYSKINDYNSDDDVVFKCREFKSKLGTLYRLYLNTRPRKLKK